MITKYFRVNKKEYCHLTEDFIFISNEKKPTRIPLEHELSDAWGVWSILNYLFFIFIFLYTSLAVNYYGIYFFKYVINYGALVLLFMSFVRLKNGLNSSKTPSITRSKVQSVYLKTPRFSYPRIVIYFVGPEKKILKRMIPVLYRKEAEQVLKEAGLLN